MIKAILSQWEILHFTGLPKEFPKCRLSSIFTTEYAEFVKCLGPAFYDHLKSAVCVYECISYDNKKEYKEGDVVNWNGVVKMALKTTTGNIPDNHDCWKNAPKFKKEFDCLEDLWCTFLGPYIAWAVVRANLPFMFRQFSAQGLIKATGAKFEGVDIKDFHTMQAAVSREVEKAFLNMDHYMKNNNECGCYDLYKGIANGCCGECGCVEAVCGCDDDCLETKEGDYEYSIG